MDGVMATNSVNGRDTLSFLLPGDLPDPGIEAGSPALQAYSLPSEPPRDGSFMCSCSIL